MAIRALSGTAAVVLATLLGAGAGIAPAYADDNPPPPLPLLPAKVTESPGFVAPPADPSDAAQPQPLEVPGASLSPPSQKQIDDARAALDRLRNQGKSTPTTLTQVAGPTSEDRSGSITARISDEGWWTIGAGLLVLLVASETTRVGVKRARHRREA